MQGLVMQPISLGTTREIVPNLSAVQVVLACLFCLPFSPAFPPNLPNASSAAKDGGHKGWGWLDLGSSSASCNLPITL